MDTEDIEVVTPGGDVVLVVGAPTDPATCRKMRVSAATLAAISPVFQTLFGPRFREGQQVRDSSSPTEIPLPDDDFSAVLRLCQLAHLTYGDLDARLEADELLHLALVVDKYCCALPLRLPCSALLQAWSQHPPVNAHTSDASFQHDLWPASTSGVSNFRVDAG